MLVDFVMTNGTTVRRWKAIRQGQWQPTDNFTGVAGFHLNEFYSSWSRLEDIVRDFLEKKKLPVETLKVFTNTTLGESWEDKGTGLDLSLNGRTENYKPDEFPDGVVLLTAGVDVQARQNRINNIRHWTKRGNMGYRSYCIIWRPVRRDNMVKVR